MWGQFHSSIAFGLNCIDDVEFACLDDYCDSRPLFLIENLKNLIWRLGIMRNVSLNLDLQ